MRAGKSEGRSPPGESITSDRGEPCAVGIAGERTVMRKADDQPLVNVLVRADPIVHYTIKSTVNGHLPSSPTGRRPGRRGGLGSRWRARGSGRGWFG